MKTHIKPIVGTIFLVFLAFYMIFLLTSFYAFTRDWLGESFKRISGLCTGVHCIDDFNRRRYYIEIDHGESYYYYIDPYFSNMAFDDMCELQDKYIDVISVPSTRLHYSGLVVSLEYNGQQLLKVQRIYKNFRVKLVIGTVLTILYVLIISVGFPLIFCELKSYCQKQRRKKQKAEKIEQLRAEGKLHPTKQLQKKKKSN